MLGLRPDFVAMQGLELGVIGPHDPDEAAALGAEYEVRAFCPGFSVPEDPVTGSLNAGLALWLVGAGHLPPAYVARQGTALGRDGRVHVSTDERGHIWVGGEPARCCGGRPTSGPTLDLTTSRGRPVGGA